MMSWRNLTFCFVYVNYGVIGLTSFSSLKFKGSFQKLFNKTSNFKKQCLFIFNMVD